MCQAHWSRALINRHDAEVKRPSGAVFDVSPLT